MVLSATATLRSWVRFPGRAESVIGFFYEILSSSELGFVAWLMAIDSPPITWDLKHTGELWLYIGTPLPNPSGNTGVMVCLLNLNYLYQNLKKCYDTEVPTHK